MESVTIQAEITHEEMLYLSLNTRQDKAFKLDRGCGIRLENGNWRVRLTFEAIELDTPSP